MNIWASRHETSSNFFLLYGCTGQEKSCGRDRQFFFPYFVSSVLGMNKEVGSREKVPVVFEAAEIERAVLPTSPLWIWSRE